MSYDCHKDKNEWTLHFRNIPYFKQSDICIFSFGRVSKFQSNHFRYQQNQHFHTFLKSELEEFSCILRRTLLVLNYEKQINIQMVKAIKNIP